MKGLKLKVVALLLCLALAVPAMAFGQTQRVIGPTQDLRAALGQVLGEHVILTFAAMQKSYDGAADFEDVSAALAANTDDISAAIAELYGTTGGINFRPIWESHITHLTEYVTATVNDDQVARDAALAELDTYRQGLSTFFADANEAFNRDVIAAELQAHINHLVAAFNAYVNNNYTDAYVQLRAAYARAYDTGDVLAEGIAAQFSSLYPSLEFNQEASDLRSTMGRLLGEHALLAVLAMQKAHDGAADAEHAAQALNKNTEELTAAISSVFGESDVFEPIWSSNIEYLGDYVNANATGYQVGRELALQALEEYRAEQAAFFASVNAQYFNEAQLTEALEMHINHLLDAYRAYATSDFEEAYAEARSAYAHMFATADALSTGVVALQWQDFEMPGEPGEQPDPGTQEPAPGPQPQPAMTITMAVGSQVVQVNGSSITMDIAPLVKDGATYIPLRYLAELIGAEIDWDQQNQVTTVTAGEDVAEFWINRTFMELNNVQRHIGNPVVVKDGRTLVPVRFIAELFGWDVMFSDIDNTVRLIK
ncbi:copper amine oxidase N-terminal domain-containing protein [Paenibacillus sp. 1P07SE]|uniref:copper amine oxidase N-terminal domain-containing protein n=1 Tax=Paenibacillus sp. 1P07SE TaxID=3132209 RepID=UPI0039A77FA9